jgi:hypothetical protein
MHDPRVSLNNAAASAIRRRIELDCGPYGFTLAI